MIRLTLATGMNSRVSSKDHWSAPLFSFLSVALVCATVLAISWWKP